MSIQSSIKREESIDAAKTIIAPYKKADEKLRALMTSTIDSYKQYIYPELFDIIKASVLFTGDIKAHYNRLGRTHKTASVYPLLQGVHDSFLASGFDSVSIPKVVGRNKGDSTIAQEGQDFCDWAYDTSNISQIKNLIKSEASLIGTSFGIGTWFREDSNRNLISKSGKEVKVSITEDHPQADFVSFFDMYTDMGAKDFYNCRRKARRRVKSLDDIERIYGTFINFNDNLRKQILEEATGVISSLDFTNIYNVNNYRNLYDTQSFENNMESVNFLYDNVFNTISKESKFCEVIEYRSKGGLAIMINGRIYYDGDSPYVVGDPFGVVTYEDRPGTYRGRGIGHKIMPHQIVASFYHSKIRDAVASHIDPMYIVYGDAIKGQNGQTPTRLSYVPSAVYAIKDPSAKNGGIQPIDFVNPQIISIATTQLNNSIEQAHSTVGTNSYVQGGQGKVERSSGNASLRVAVTAARLKPLNNSVARFDEHMFNIWLTLAIQNMDDEIMVNILGKDGYELKAVTLSNIINNVRVTVDVDAIRDITKAERANTLTQMLNSLSPYNINPISGTPAIAPEDIIRFISESLNFDGFKPMSAEDRKKYIQEHLDIKKQIEESVSKPTEQIPDSVNNPVPNIDIDSIKGNFG